MAVDTNSYTLGELAKISNEPAIQKASISMIKAGSVFQDIPIETKKSLIYRGARWEDDLPTPTWRNINEPGTAVKGSPRNYQEQVFIARDNVDVDEFLSMDENAFDDPFESVVNAYLMGLSYDLNNKVINNNHKTGDKKCFVGLRGRLDNPGTYGSNPSCKIDGGGVDLSDTNLNTNGSAPGRRMSRYVQQALDEMGRPDGDGVVIYANDDFLRRWEESLKAGGGGFTAAKDTYDKQVATFGSAKIRRIGRTAPVRLANNTVKQDQVITSNETADGSDGVAGTDNRTSLYLTIADQNDGISGWQMVPMKPKPKSTNDDNVIDRVTFSWAVGLRQKNTRAVARLVGMKVGA